MGGDGSCDKSEEFSLNIIKNKRISLIKCEVPGADPDERDPTLDRPAAITSWSCFPERASITLFKSASTTSAPESVKTFLTSAAAITVIKIGY